MESSAPNNLSLQELADKAMAPGGVAVLDRQLRGHIQKRCFVAKDLVKWLRANDYSGDEYHGNRIGASLVTEGQVRAVREGVDFWEPNEFYRFKEHWEEGKNTEDKDTWHGKF
jgi:hypothetical protein